MAATNENDPLGLLQSSNSDPLGLLTPDKVPEKRSAIGEIVNQGKAGVLSDLPQMIGQSIQYTSDPGKAVYGIGKSIADFGTEQGKRPDLQAAPEQHNAVTNALASGARMIPQSLAPAALIGGGLALLPEAAIGGTAALGISALGGSLPMGMSQAQSTLEKARAAGVPESDALAAARRTGLIEAAGETAGTYAGGKLLGIGAKALKGTGEKAAESTLANIAAPGVVKPFLKELPKTAAVEVGTEMGQNAGEAAVEKAYGVDNQSPSDAAMQAVGPTLGMTALLAPFGLAGFAHNASAARNRTAALSAPDTEPALRKQIADSFTAELAKVDPGAAAQFATNTDQAIAAGHPIAVDASLFQPRTPQVTPQVTPQAATPDFTGYTPEEIAAFQKEQADRQRVMANDLAIQRTMAADNTEQAIAASGTGPLGQAVGAGLRAGSIAAEQVIPQAGLTASPTTISAPTSPNLASSYPDLAAGTAASGAGAVGGAKTATSSPQVADGNAMLDDAWNDGFETGNDSIVVSKQDLEYHYGPLTDEQVSRYNETYQSGAREGNLEDKPSTDNNLTATPETTPAPVSLSGAADNKPAAAQPADERYPASPVGSLKSGYKITGGEKFTPDERMAHAAYQRSMLVAQSKDLRSNTAIAPISGSQFEVRNNRAKKADTLANNKALIEAWDKEIARAKALIPAANKPATPIPESGAPGTELKPTPQPVVASAPTPSAQSIVKKPDGSIHVIGYPVEALNAARTKLKANASIDQKGQAVFRPGVNLTDLKTELNPGAAYIPEKEDLKSADFPQYVSKVTKKFSNTMARAYAMKNGAKALASKDEATAYANALMNGEGGTWEPHKVKGEWRAVRVNAAAATPATPATPEAAPAVAAAPKPRKPKPSPFATTNPQHYAEASRKKFIAEIKAMGGITSTEAKNITGLPIERANTLMPGLFADIKSGGRGLDEIGHNLSEGHYLPGFEHDDAATQEGRVRDLVRDALDKKTVMTVGQQDRYNELEKMAEDAKAEPHSAEGQAIFNELEDRDLTLAEFDAIFSGIPVDEESDRRSAAILKEQEDESAKNAAVEAQNQEAVARRPEVVTQGSQGPVEPQGVQAENRPSLELQGQTPAQVAAAAKGPTKAEKAAADRARIKLESEAGAGAFNLTPRQAPAPIVEAKAKAAQADLTATPRFDAGAALTKEQRKTVLASLVDVYKQKGAEKETRINANGDEYSAYPHQPELFEKSDITGAMVRYYVTLPDGKIAHPTELFPDYTQSDIDTAVSSQIAAERKADDFKKARVEALNRRMAGTVADANRIFWKTQIGTSIQPEDTTLLTNGTQYARTLKDNAERDAELLGDGWQVNTTIPAQKASDSEKVATEGGKPDARTFADKQNERRIDHIQAVIKKAGRIYLDVPFASKDSAKEVGAKWDKEKVAWFSTPLKDGASKGNIPLSLTRFVPDQGLAAYSENGARVAALNKTAETGINHEAVNSKDHPAEWNVESTESNKPVATREAKPETKQIRMVTVGAFHEFYGDTDGVAKVLGKPAAADHVAISVMSNTSKVMASLKAAGYDIKQVATRKDAQEAKPAANDTGTAMFSRTNQPSFYSQLSRAIESAPDKVFGGAGQFKLWLNGNAAKLGVKKDEIEFSGINDFLDMQGKGKVSKADVVGFLSENGVKVEDVVLGTPTKDAADRALMEFRERGRMIGMSQSEVNDLEIELWKHEREPADSPQGMEEVSGTLVSALDARDNADPEGVSQTKFAQHTPPGGIPGTYREILVTLPSKQGPLSYPDPLTALPDGYEVIRDSSQAVGRQYGITPPGQVSARPIGGRRYANAEEAKAGELQILNEEQNVKAADAWRAQNEGFRSSHFDQPNILVHLRTDEVTGADGKRYLRVVEIQSDWGQRRKKEDEFRKTGTAGEGVPNAPFIGKTEAWVSLGIKRAIQQAIDSEVDGVVFATGSQNADLYDLSKQISRIDWMKSDNGYTIAADDLNGKTVIMQSGMSAAELSDTIGKEITDKIVSSEKTKGRIDGLDLKVGGEGMRAFYDKIVPQVAGDVLKKLGGGKISSIDIQAPKSELPGARGRAEDRINAREASTNQGFTIPESLRNKVMAEGLPLFRKGESTNGLTEAESIKRVVRVQNIVNQIKAGWKNAPKVVVITGMDDHQVPKEVSAKDAEMRSQGAEGEPRGFIYDGIVYIVSGQQKSVYDVVTTLAHEVLGHAGLRGMFGTELDGILDQITAVRRGDIISKAIEYGLHEAGDGATRAEVFASMTQSQKRQAAEEVLAEMAQTQPQASFVQRAIALIRAWLRKAGLKMMLTDNDIISRFLLPARAYIERGAKPASITEMLEAAYHRVFHGTPHIWQPEPGFPHGRPRLDKMGSGEGDNAFGWGIYFAEATREANVFKKPVSEKNPQHMQSGAEGNVYQLDVPDSVLLHTLDYNRPLYKQTPEIIKLLGWLNQSTISGLFKGEINGKKIAASSVEGLYDQLVYAIGSDKAASEYLASKGIVGIKHFDSYSTWDSKQTHNYVIWDQPTLDKIALLERNGEKLDAMREASFSRTNQTETEAFKKWFGDSKVVGIGGYPLIVYHGSPDVRGIFSGGFKDRSRGAFFAAADYHVANSYANDHRALDYQNAEPQTIPLYLSIKNPMVVDAEGRHWRDTEKHVQEAKAAGHDGIIIKNSIDFYENPPSRGKKTTTVYAWFSPTQAKSAVDGQLISRVDGKPIEGATGNNGEFDPSNPNIIFSRTRIVGDSIDGAMDKLRQTFGKPRTESASQYAEQNRRIREEHITAWDKGRKWLKRQLTPAGLLPQSVFDTKIERDSQFEAVEFDVSHMVGALERTVKLDYKVAADKLDETTQRLLSDALAGKIDKNIPEATKVALLGMRSYIDKTTVEYLGILEQQFNEAVGIAEITGDPKAVADAKAKLEFIDTITGNVGQYVHRSYRAFDDKDWARKVPDNVLDDARTYLLARYEEDGTPNAENRVEVVLNEILKHGTAYESMEAFIKESKLGAKDLSILKKRKQIAPEIRALLGEYTDPRIGFAKSATKMGRLIFNQRFLDRVKQLGMGEFLFTDDTKPPEATVQIAGEKSDVYAPLNGMWVTPEVNQAFRDALGKEQMADWYRTIVQINGAVKYGKTVLSPTTAARNWMSAFFFTVANGHFDMTHMAKSVSLLKEYFGHRSDAEKLAYLRELKVLGVVYDTPYAGEMMRLLADTNTESMLGSGKGLTLKLAMNYATKFYQYGDDFWKVIGFENEKRMLIESGYSESDAKREAAARIRDTYPTYSMVGRGVQQLRRFPLVGSFVSFPAEIIRTSYNMLRYLEKDYKNPAMRSRAIKRATGLAIASGFAYALQALSMAMLGYDDDDEEAVRLMAAPWQRNSNLLFTGRDEEGNIRFLDLSFIDPYNYWKRPIVAITRGRPWRDAVKDVAKETLTPFFGTDIAAGAIFDAMANKKDSGGTVYNEHDAISSQVADIGNHLRKSLQPGLFSNMERTYKAINGDVAPSGKQYDLSDEAFGWMGFRVSTLDPKVALFYRSFDFQEAKSGAEKHMRDALREPGDLSESELHNAYEMTVRLRDDAYSDMQLLVKSAMESGLSRQQIRSSLKNSGISQRDIFALMSDRVPSYMPTPESVRNIANKSRDTFGPEAFRRVMDRYREVRSYDSSR